MSKKVRYSLDLKGKRPLTRKRGIVQWRPESTIALTMLKSRELPIKMLYAIHHWLTLVISKWSSKDIDLIWRDLARRSLTSKAGARMGKGKGATIGPVYRAPRKSLLLQINFPHGSFPIALRPSHAWMNKVRRKCMKLTRGMLSLKGLFPFLVLRHRGRG